MYFHVRERITMKMTINNYRNFIRSVVLKRGQAYLKEKRIQTLERNKDGMVHAEVQGSELYTVSLNLSDSGEISKARCSCQYDYEGLCKHLAAVLLTLEKKFETHYSSLSSGVVSSLISAYRKETVQQEELAEEEKVHIIPVLTSHGSALTYELKIGRDRMYLVQDVRRLYECFQNGWSKRYGKGLEFIHTFDAIDETSKKLLDLTILNLATQQRYYTSYREFPLDKANIDSFFALFRDKEVLLDNVSCSVEFRNPKISLEIKKVMNNRYSLKLSRSLQLLGAGQYACILNEWSDTLMMASPTFTSTMYELLRQLSQAKGRMLYIAEREMAAFYAAVLKPVAKFAEIKGIELLEDFIPPEMTPQLYVDCGENNEFFARLEFSYGENAADYHDPIAERRVEASVLRYFQKNPDDEVHPLIIADDDTAYAFLTEGLAEFSRTMELFISYRFRRMAVRPPVKPSIGVRPDGSLLELEITDDHYSSEELLELLTAYRRGAKYHRLRDGSFALIDESLSDLDMLTNTLNIKDKDFLKDKLHIPQYRMLYLDSLKTNENLRLKRSADFKAAVHHFRNSVEDSTRFTVPEHLDDIMRDYQKYGFRWMKTISGYGFGGILADDMGLGKTIQAIALMQDAKQTGNQLPHFVVCPSSLTLNWESELKRFAPSLRSLVIIGTAAQRNKLIAQIPEADVIITSYAVLTRDIAKYEEFQFRLHFIDEAQYIKNHSTQAAKAVKGIRSEIRFALTGTPVENSLAELWSIFDFIMPNYLFGYTRFKQRFETPIVSGKDEQAVRSLQNTVSPFILRRLKADVLKELPEKTETVLTSRMEGEQSKVYSANVVSVKKSLGKGFEGHEERIKLLAMLTRLRQLCCDPHLVYENYKGKSAKLEQCMELIESCVYAGHKILLFSQFTSMLDIIAGRLEKMGVSYNRLTGRTKAAERLRMVNVYNADDTKVFLISLKAGGTGLNLTGADIVIHYDPWWNLSAENQASDRAYRIGQKRNVQIYKLIAEKSIEENILKLQESKAALSDIAVSGDSDIMRMSAEDLLHLLESSN